MITPNPDCQAGKHTACSGEAWDDTMDELAACPCLCHSDPAREAVVAVTASGDTVSNHLIESAQTTLKCGCGVTITAETLMEAFVEHFEHAEAATAPAEESDR